MSTLSIFVLAYALMFALAAYAEFTTHRTRGLPAIFTALFLSAFTGVLMCVAAAKMPGGPWRTGSAEQAEEASRVQYNAGTPRSGGDRAASGAGRALSGEVMDKSAQRAGGGGSADVEIVSSDPQGEFRNAIRSGVAQALSGEAKASPVAGDKIKDCDICPEMVVVGGGSTLIGAALSDPLAAPSERPQRAVRFWPGFAISRDPVSADLYESFLKDSVRPRAGTSSCRGPASVAPQRDAVCVAPDDSDAFAVWLSARARGVRYRLATAAEWEFAVRTAGAVQLASTSSEALLASPLTGMGTVLSEIVADCYETYIPPIGQERVSHSTDLSNCRVRVLKGTSAQEDRRHARPSARRPIEADTGSPLAGFRVVRELR